MPPASTPLPSPGDGASRDVRTRTRAAIARVRAEGGIPDEERTVLRDLLDDVSTTTVRTLLEKLGERLRTLRSDLGPNGLRETLEALRATPTIAIIKTLEEQEVATIDNPHLAQQLRHTLTVGTEASALLEALAGGGDAAEHLPLGDTVLREPIAAADHADASAQARWEEEIEQRIAAGRAARDAAAASVRGAAADVESLTAYLTAAGGMLEGLVQHLDRLPQELREGAAACIPPATSIERLPAIGSVAHRTRERQAVRGIARLEYEASRRAAEHQQELEARDADLVALARERARGPASVWEQSVEQALQQRVLDRIAGAKPLSAAATLAATERELAAQQLFLAGLVAEVQRVEAVVRDGAAIGTSQAAARAVTYRASLEEARATAAAAAADIIACEAAIPQLESPDAIRQTLRRKQEAINRSRQAAMSEERASAQLSLTLVELAEDIGIASARDALQETEHGLAIVRDAYDGIAESLYGVPAEVLVPRRDALIAAVQRVREGLRERIDALVSSELERATVDVPAAATSVEKLEESLPAAFDLNALHAFVRAGGRAVLFSLAHSSSGWCQYHGSLGRASSYDFLPGWSGGRLSAIKRLIASKTDGKVPWQLFLHKLYDNGPHHGHWDWWVGVRSDTSSDPVLWIPLPHDLDPAAAQHALTVYSERHTLRQRVKADCDTWETTVGADARVVTDPKNT